MYFYLLFAASLAWIARPAWRVWAITAMLALGVALTRAATADDTSAWRVFLGQPLVFEFAFGMVAAGALRRGLRLPAGIALGLVVVAAALLAAWAAPDTRLASAGLPALAMVWALASLPSRQSVVSRAMTRLGDASYTLYLVQPFVIGVLWLLWRGSSFNSGVAGALGFVGACLLASAAVAWPIHRWIERPLTRTATRWLTTPLRSPESA